MYNFLKFAEFANAIAAIVEAFQGKPNAAFLLVVALYLHIFALEAGEK